MTKESAHERGLADLEMHESLVNKAKELLELVHKAEERGLSVQVVVNTTRKKSSIGTDRHFNKYAKRVKYTLIDNKHPSCLIHLTLAILLLSSPAHAVGRDGAHRDVPLRLTHNQRGDTIIRDEGSPIREEIRAANQWLCLFGKPSLLVGIDRRKYAKVNKR